MGEKIRPYCGNSKCERDIGRRNFTLKPGKPVLANGAASVRPEVPESRCWRCNGLNICVPAGRASALNQTRK